MRQTDGRAITNPENAQNFSHAEIKQAADRMNPDGLDGAFDAWSAIAAAVSKAGQQFETAIARAVDQRWEGAAADQAVLGIRDYAARLGELGESLDQQSTPLSAAASAAARFKVAVPPVVENSGNSRGPELRNSQEEQARDDMSTLYIEPYGTTAPAIPTLPPPVEVVSGAPGSIPGADFDLPRTNGGEGTNGAQAGAAPDGRTGIPDKTEQSGAARDGKAGGSDTTQGVTSDKAGDTEAVDKSESAAARPDSTDQASATTQPTGSQATGAQPTATAPAASQTFPASAGSQTISAAPSNGTQFTVTPVAGNPTTTNPAESIPPGAAPIRTGAPVAGNAAAPVPAETPSPGRSIPGQPGTVPSAAGAQPAGTPGRVGGTGAAGYSSMFPRGARGRRDEDNEHKSAKYLRTEEHGEELIGTVEPTVPPAIGDK